MPKIIPGNWTLELTPEQIEAIDWYIANPPKYYKFFYKLYKKVLNKVIFFSIIACIIMGIIHNASERVDLFDPIKYIFFGVCGIALWALGSHLYKVFYIKRYAKKIGLTLKEWDWVTIGLKWDI